MTSVVIIKKICILIYAKVPMIPALLPRWIATDNRCTRTGLGLVSPRLVKFFGLELFKEKTAPARGVYLISQKTSHQIGHRTRTLRLGTTICESRGVLDKLSKLIKNKLYILRDYLYVIKTFKYIITYIIWHNARWMHQCHDAQMLK